MLDTIAALVIVLDREGRIVRFNRECERVTGYSFEEIKDRPLWDFLLVPEEVQQVKALFHGLINGKTKSRGINYWLTRDGRRRQIAWSNTVIMDQDGAVEFVIGTGIDITENQALKEALKQSEEKFSKVFRASPLWIALTTLEDGTYLDVNDAFTRITGFEKGEVLQPQIERYRACQLRGSRKSVPGHSTGWFFGGVRASLSAGKQVNPERLSGPRK